MRSERYHDMSVQVPTIRNTITNPGRPYPVSQSTARPTPPNTRTNTAMRRTVLRLFEATRSKSIHEFSDRGVARRAATAISRGVGGGRSPPRSKLELHAHGAAL